MGRNKEGRIGKPKLLYLPLLIGDMLKGYSNSLHKSQSAIVAEMVCIADADFRKKYHVDDLKKPSESEKTTDADDKDKGKQISDAYMRKILDKNYTEGWMGY